ncbi:MAG: efflux RND transporter permease subunit [Deltaproteobacteria bacterium]|nr:efflux RND transporter permease subunit [Deltaproteobacteria bacterium]
MNLPELSIKRPIFITCAFILMLAIGGLSLLKLGVDLFPNVSFPVVFIQTVYPGASPNEIETLISKPLEEEISTVAGIKTVRSINREGLSQVVAEFTLETPIRDAEQQIRDRVSSARSKLPKDIDEPVIRRIDPADQPIVILALTANLPEGQLYDLANEILKPKFEQINQVGLVEIEGGRKREIRAELDRKKLKAYEVSANMVAQRIGSAGQNIPIGKIDSQKSEMSFRSLGEFQSPKDIENVIVNFFGNDVPVTVKDVGKVVDGLQDEKSRAFVNGSKALFINVYRQSGANTIAVAKEIKKKMAALNQEYQSNPNKAHIGLVYDTSKFIQNNVDDVEESILLGIILTLVVVLFFLGNLRSTFITGLALPNSLLGAFILMYFAGFTINIMTLLALSLAVGLLIDDAIVVRENIFRHIELGLPPRQAALVGTSEVTLAVIATTATVLAVFGPVSFLSGIVGQFFREFGLTICFAMIISLIDALTMAPMLSAYLATPTHKDPKAKKSLWDLTIGRAITAVDNFQKFLEHHYETVLRFSIKNPVIILGCVVVIVLGSGFILKFVPKTFLPPQDFGEFEVRLDLPPGKNLDATEEVAKQLEAITKKYPEVERTVLTVGSAKGPANEAKFFVQLVPAKKRKINTSDFKDLLRKDFQPFAFANPRVQDIDLVAGGQRPFNLNISGYDLDQLEKIAVATMQKLKANPALKDVDISFRPGKPEFQVAFNKQKSEKLGVSSEILGAELRTQIEGITPARFRESGKEYDVRVRLQEDQRNLQQNFSQTFIPNINGYLVKLSDVSEGVEAKGPANINRQDRGRYVQISADISADGPGMGRAMQDVQEMFASGDLKLPEGVKYEFIGQAEDFKNLMESMLIAAALAILFIYLVLASLYESFITPFTIMLVIPLAACGAFYALFVMGKSLNIFSMIGCIMLLGVATKNSILLVDYANQMIGEGKDRMTALVTAGRTRLRPILMTTVALIAGMLPVAIGLNEASRQRTSMGIAIIGGLISSTLLTLVVIPAAFSTIDDFRLWIRRVLGKISGTGK